MFVEVQVALNVDSVDKPFHYGVPPELAGKVKPGMRVEVPFGPRKAQAFVLRVIPEPDMFPVKDILKVLDREPLLTEEMLGLSRWLGKYYLCSRSAVLQAMLPFPTGKVPGRKPSYARLTLSDASALDAAASLEPKAPRQARVLKILLEKGPQGLQELQRQTGTDRSVIRALEGKGYLAVKEGEVSREESGEGSNARRGFMLTPHQERALYALENALAGGAGGTFLLHGVTGSGKTEIYLRITEKALARGRGGLILVPEISLTAQMIERFQELFGSRVALLHSKLSQGERFREWSRLLSGEARIAVGPRSAVFAPVKNPGVIVLDEEHERTYKQEETPRYHALRVAQERARLNGSLVLLGSATPSLESYTRALEGDYTLLSLPNRVRERPMPPVTIVDMREEIKAGNRKMFSRQLLDSLRETVAAEKKVLLFLNRRGHSTCVLCRECGLVMRCPHCDIAMTFHSRDKKLLCHYCSHRISVPDICPQCRSRYIKFFGTGTQRVEEEIRSFFPETGIWRMDTDTTTRKGAHKRILQSFTRQGAAILIGTQMIAKGLDIPGITLVGVLAADMGLNLPDFRAGERTFQLLTQVAGRTGRGSEVGRVIVQTYSPGHYAVLAARGHDYQGFYEEEIISRRELGYPPFSFFIRLLFTGRDETHLAAACTRAAGMEGEFPGIEFLGPVKCPFARMADSSRWHLVLKGKEGRLLRACARKIMGTVREKHRNISVTADVDPLTML